MSELPELKIKDKYFRCPEHTWNQSRNVEFNCGTCNKKSITIIESYEPESVHALLEKIERRLELFMETDDREIIKKTNIILKLIEEMEKVK